MAVHDGQVLGFANFYQWQHGDFCALGNMMVAPAARGLGVARYLIGVMENLAREQYKARLMKISCFNANAAGLLLYTRSATSRAPSPNATIRTAGAWR